MLVTLGRPKEARVEYQATLTREPGRRHAMQALGTSVNQ